MCNHAKKESKSMANVWSDDDSERSQEEEKNNVNHIAFTSSLISTYNLGVQKIADFVAKDFF